LPVIGLAAVAVVAVLAIAFFVISPLVSSGGDENSTYVEAIAGAPARVNPLFAYLNDPDRDVAALVFSGLTRIGDDGEPLPDLAESWEIEDTAVTFNLRPNVTWHDGAPFTSADVVFTYHLLGDPAFQGDPDQGPLWRQINCNAPNDLTVICRLPQPYAPFLTYASIGILPAHILENADIATLQDNAFNMAPIGTGPYRLIQINARRAVLNAFEGYHLGAPAMPELELRFFPDTATAAASVIRGDSDGLLLDSRAAQSDFEVLESQEELRAYSAGRSAYSVLYLNNREPPLNQLEVRQAIARAIDFDAITDGILGGRAVRGGTPIVPGTWAYDADAESPGRNLDESRLLLEVSGWELADGASIRSRNETELRISIMTDQDPIRGVVAEAIATQLAEVGIAATVVREESTDLIRNFLIPRQYQAAIFTWDPGADPDPYPAWHSSQITATGRNIAGYSSNEADRLMEEARRTTDFDERQRNYFAFQQQFIEDFPSVILFYPVFTYFVAGNVEGVEIGTLFSTASRFANIHEWSISQDPAIRD
jgi:peptide/nickel transport system substrate-binding protein